MGYEFLCLSSNGKSGGIIYIWEASSFNMCKFIKGDGFLLIKGVWSNPISFIGVFSAYTPQQFSRKRKLWADISEIINSNNNMIWIILVILILFVRKMSVWGLYSLSLMRMCSITSSRPIVFMKYVLVVRNLPGLAKTVVSLVSWIAFLCLSIILIDAEPYCRNSAQKTI